MCTGETRSLQDKYVYGLEETHHFASGHLLNWWAKCGSSSNFISRHSIHMDTELLIKIHNVYLQYATGRDPLRSHSASGYSFLLSENCLLSADQNQSVFHATERQVSSAFIRKQTNKKNAKSWLPFSYLFPSLLGWKVLARNKPLT